MFQAEVLANKQICDEHFRIVLKLDDLPPTQPGQFVQLLCRQETNPASIHTHDWSADRPPVFTGRELTEREPLLRRPFSIAARRDDPTGSTQIDIIYRTIGAGTSWLGRVEAGTQLSVLGPLGNTFTIRRARNAALIGGGVGIPPMLYLGSALRDRGKAVIVFCGARSANLLPLGLATDVEPSEHGLPKMCIQEFAALKIQSVVATDDGSAGYAGLISEAFDRWISGEQFDPDDLVVYSCGPEPMMRAVGKLCLERGIACQLAMERHMACGMGTCQSCIVKIRDETAKGFSYKLCCTDGPVFDARDILWQ